jgi:hypothetical protein
MIKNGFITLILKWSVEVVPHVVHDFFHVVKLLIELLGIGQHCIHSFRKRSDEVVNLPVISNLLVGPFRHFFSCPSTYLCNFTSYFALYTALVMLKGYLT